MESRREQSIARSPLSKRVVVAGPTSDVTVPGLMTTEVVGALTSRSQVVKLSVNLSKDFDSGLHRAKSLSATFREFDDASRLSRNRTGLGNRQIDLREPFRDGADMAIALAWPGLDNSWIGEFVYVAGRAGAQTVVLVVSHPSTNAGAVSVARELVDSDLVLVGDAMEATLLSAALGSKRPVIEVHGALSLNGRSVGAENKSLTTFLRKDDEQALLSVLTAFDAIPVGWVEDYDLRVIMRYSGRAAPDRVAASYHSGRVSLIGEDFTSVDMRQITSDSSAVSVADPVIDSRVFATAVESGVATVVLAGGMVTEVGEGYVGGLLADIHRPTSVYVAHNHALRLSQLRFPGPQDWFDLAARLMKVVDRDSRDMSDVGSPRFGE